MPVALTARDRRALLLGAAVLAPALLFAFVARPFAGALAERRDRLAAERDLLARELRLLADARRFPDALRDAEAELMREAPRLFAGSDPVAATSALEGFVAAQAIAHRVFIQRSESLAPESAAQGVVALRTTVRAVGDLDGLLSFLRSLEAGRKLVRIERLSLERVEEPDGGQDRVVIAASALVRGYALAADPTGPLAAAPAEAPARAPVANRAGTTPSGSPATSAAVSAATQGAAPASASARAGATAREGGR
ncbi:MAG TPA: GspMb/PilO family protein [Longimicrobiales bacterium]